MTDADGSREELWEDTQDPDVHARRDRRLPDVEHLPREADESQRFTSRTHVGGVGVAGTGESTGDAETDGEWISGLAFRSADSRPHLAGNGVEFRTGYSHEPR